MVGKHVAMVKHSTMVFYLTYSGTSVLRKTSTALQLAIQFTFGCKLQDEIHTRGVVKVTIETEDIGMPAGQ